MIAILLPHTCHGSCESILSLGVKGFSFGIQETLPTEPVDILADAQRDSAVSALADDYFGALAGELSVGIACLRRYHSDSRLAVVAESLAIDIGFFQSDSLTWVWGARGDSGWESLTDSVLNIFRAVPPMSAPCVYSVRLASFKGSRSAMAERERVSAMVERRKLPDPLVGLEYENCVLGEYDPKRPPRLEPAGVLDQPLVRLSGRFH